MRSEHPGAEQLAAYQRRTLTAGELLAVDDHLFECDSCRRQLDTPERLDASLRSMDAVTRPDPNAFGDHVPYDQLAAYVDDTIDGVQREIVDTHLELCAPCTEEVRDLRAFALSMTTEERRNVIADAPRPGVFDWFRGWLALSSPALQGALGLAAVALTALVLWQEMRYRRMESRTAALSDSAEALRQANLSLRGTADSLKAENDSLGQRIAAIDAGTPLSPPSGAEAGSSQSLQDTAGTARIGGLRDTISVVDQIDLPPALSASVRELVMGGDVKPVDQAAPKLMALLRDINRGTTPVGQAAATSPTPTTPVRTGVRSVTPTLRWRGVRSAQEYMVTVAGEDDTVVWQSSAGTQTTVVVPSGTLQRGRVYFWQVEATGAGAPTLSPPVGFWVLDATMVRDVEAAERRFDRSALVRASTYAAHGLYDDALVQVEELARLNPRNPQVQKMREGLRRQLGHD